MKEAVRAAIPLMLEKIKRLDETDISYNTNYGEIGDDQLELFVSLFTIASLQSQLEKELL